MTEAQLKAVLAETGKIGGIVSALAHGQGVKDWSQRIQESLDEIARVAGEATDYRGRR
jgi:hypothetical protein